MSKTYNFKKNYFNDCNILMKILGNEHLLQIQREQLYEYRPINMFKIYPADFNKIDTYKYVFFTCQEF